MDNVKVIFRKSENPYTKEKEITAFFPELTANYGNIVCYQHIGQHGEADLSFYHSTKKAMPDEYENLLKELKSIYHDYKLIVMQRINYTDLKKAWIKIA